MMVWWLPEGRCGVRKGEGGKTYGDGRSDFGWRATMQYSDDVSQNCTLETCIILLTNVTPINLIKEKKSIQVVDNKPP